LEGGEKMFGVATVCILDAKIADDKAECDVAEKGINIPVNVIEKVAIMVDQVKDLQQKINEANNNICRLKTQFM
jgi:hypothetical protein